ncbi:MAG: glycosyltransferase family 2 protein [Pseudomonadota bacterium]
MKDLALLVSVVIPVFRNAPSLEELHARIVAAVTAVPETSYEVIYCDDGSDDDSHGVLQKIHSEDPNAVVVKLSRNFGQHSANAAAFEHARGDVVVNMSADLQDPPEVITELINKIVEGNDIVLATREKTDETAFRSFTSWLHYRLVRISLPTYPTGGFDFWAVNKRAFKAFRAFTDINRRNQIDLLSIGFKVAEISYEKRKRKHGKSQYNFLKRLDISFSQIFSTATWPMRLAAFFGFLFTVSGFLYALYLVISFFFRETAQPGWTSVIVIILLVGGINSLMISLMGEYIWRIYYETKQRPLFFVDTILDRRAGAENDSDA